MREASNVKREDSFTFYVFTFHALTFHEMKKREEIK
jgi:hypothetical protein